MIATINPANNRTLATFDALTSAELDEKLARAAAAYRTYRKTSIAERVGHLIRAAEILDSEKQNFGRLMTLEMGKPIEAARQEAAKCALACRYYAEHGARLLCDEHVDSNSFIRYQPIGPILAVMPWNFPFWQVFRFLAPALAAGNVGLLKHSSNVPQCALAIEDIVRRADFPDDVFQTLLIGSDLVARVINDARVKAVTLTGSEPAGRDVASLAGKQIKKTVLELGGSDPFIVMPSADLEAAAKTAVTARCINNGQSCIAAKRFIVHRDVADEFEQRLVAGMEQLVIGDPMDEKTQVGPLATPAILKDLEDQVQRSIELGARVLTGARRLDRPGNFYAPTVLTDIVEDSPAFREELFGPVASLFRVADLDAALELANHTTFGLGASAWTRDAVEQNRFIDDIESGMVFVNGMVASDPRLPFGGVKASGYGRELGAYGLREFVNIKTVVVR
jgi:succinate-semialdehyde dehydrogenase/glutarate-semialdehyde dehydrogenase